MIERSVYQPSQWTVPTGRLVFPVIILVGMPTHDVTRGQILKWLVMADLTLVVNQGPSAAVSHLLEG